MPKKMSEQIYDTENKYEIHVKIILMVMCLT